MLYWSLVAKNKERNIDISRLTLILCNDDQHKLNRKNLQHKLGHKVVSPLNNLIRIIYSIHLTSSHYYAQESTIRRRMHTLVTAPYIPLLGVFKNSTTFCSILLFGATCSMTALQTRQRSPTCMQPSQKVWPQFPETGLLSRPPHSLQRRWNGISPSFGVLCFCQTCVCGHARTKPSLVTRTAPGFPPDTGSIFSRKSFGIPEGFLIFTTSKVLSLLVGQCCIK